MFVFIYKTLPNMSLPLDAMLAWYMLWSYVCLSVRHKPVLLQNS